MAPHVPRIEITHTPKEGTLLYGSSRGDGVNDVLHGLRMGWKWSRGLDGFYIQHSRDEWGSADRLEKVREALEDGVGDVVLLAESLHLVAHDVLEGLEGRRVA